MAAIDKQYVADKKKTPYVWEAIDPDSGLILATEWNENFDHETALATLGTPIERVIDESDLAKTLFTVKLNRAYRMRARALRPDLPTLELDLPQDAELIFNRRGTVTVAIGIDGVALPDAPRIEFETMLFGRIFPDGKMDLAQIWPNGEIAGHSSLHEAYAII